MSADEGIFLGYGKSRNFTARPGMILEERGRCVFEIDPKIFCRVCEEGCGCTCCGFTGKESERQKRNLAGKNGPRRKRT